MKVRIVERAGTKLKHMLPGLQEPNVCNDVKCFLHSTGGKGNHDAESVVYRAECATCAEVGPSSKPDKDGNIVTIIDRTPGVKAVYTGESGRSILIRGEQHLNDMRNPESHQTNAFVRHAKEYHAGETPVYNMSLVGVYPKPLERQIVEGVYIGKSEMEGNNKLDHFAPAVSRVIISNTLSD